MDPPEESELIRRTSRSSHVEILAEGDEISNVLEKLLQAHCLRIHAEMEKSQQDLMRNLQTWLSGQSVALSQSDASRPSLRPVSEWSITEDMLARKSTHVGVRRAVSSPQGALKRAEIPMSKGPVNFEDTKVEDTVQAFEEKFELPGEVDQEETKAIKGSDEQGYGSETSATSGHEEGVREPRPRRLSLSSAATAASHFNPYALANGGWSHFKLNQKRLQQLVHQGQHDKLSRGKTRQDEFQEIVMKSEGADGDDELTFIQRIVLSARFELVFALLILGNAIVMALEAQFRGHDAGHEIGYKGVNSKMSDEIPWAQDVWDVAEWMFGLVFLLELVLKIWALRLVFFKDLWNLFDSLIVLSWVLGVVAETNMPIPPGLLRLTRLVRLLRLLRLVRTIQGFDSLYLMTASIRSSLSALGWSSAILLLGELMNALLLQVLLESYVKSDADEAERFQVFERFGTCSKAMLTMFEMMFGNWHTVTRLLVTNVNEWFMIYGIAHQLFVGFAVLEVITGIFFHETFKVASMDDSIMMSQKNRQNDVHRQKMDTLFHYADNDGNGSLDREEFQNILRKQEVRTWLAAMDLDVADVDTVFDLVANSDGQVSAAELVDGVARLKGPARSIDVVALLKNVEKMEHRLMSKLNVHDALLNTKKHHASRSNGFGVFHHGSSLGARTPAPPLRTAAQAPKEVAPAIAMDAESSVDVNEAIRW